jgi:hypothetical protein
MSMTDGRLGYIGRRAYELARSGYYKDFVSIQLALMDEGYADGVAWLEWRGVISALEQICEIACGNPEPGYAVRAPVQQTSPPVVEKS